MSAVSLGVVVLGDRATNIVVQRVPLLEDSVGGTNFSRTVEMGQVSAYSMSASEQIQVDAGINTLWAHCDVDTQRALSYASASVTLSYSKTTFSHQCPPGDGCYIYQVQLKVETDNGDTFQSNSDIQITDVPLPLVHEDVPVPEGFDMRSKMVTLLQPSEHKGNYQCRDIEKSVCSELESNYGCRTVDDYSCSGGQDPFKWGGDAYFGGFDLPEGLCVTTYRHWGYCEEKNLQHGKVCAAGGDRTVTVWKSDDRTCSWKFELAPGYVCPGMLNAALVGNVTVV
jgi:hypothetical protein